jgi:cell division protein FtsB
MLIFLGGALFLTLLYGAFVSIQKQQLAQSKVSLEQEIEQYAQREKKYIVDANAIKEQLATAEKARAEIEEKLKALEGVDLTV